MNRLTNEFVLSNIESGFHLDDEHIKFVKDKLEYADKMKAIEEQLCCPLEIVSKLIGSYIILDGEPCYVMGILKVGDNLCIHYSKCYEVYDDIEPLSNYGKTFLIDEDDKIE